MGFFKETSVNIGDIKPGSINKVEWVFDQVKKSDIAINPNGTYAIVPACGCTANFEVLEDKIVANYTDNGNTLGPIGKSVTVYYNDVGVETMLKNKKGVDVYNPALGKTVLMFSANVVR